MSKPSKFRFSIDRGGTFTDIYAEVPNQTEVVTLKLLSEDPNNYPDAPREGIRRILEQVSGVPHPKEGFAGSQIEWIRMGTTVATNALLERKGEPTVLVISKGFKDALRIGYQNRPRIFDLRIELPERLYCDVIEVAERVLPCHKASSAYQDQPTVLGTTGEALRLLRSLDLAQVEQQLQAVYNKGLRAIAVVFMHAYVYPNHEQQVGALAQRIGFRQVSLSHKVMPTLKLVPRGDTTVVDAYLSPTITHYLKSFRAGFSDDLKDTRLLLMQSHGGLIDAQRFLGSRALLSGPAGGVVAIARNYGNTGQPVIGFDMGGTSTDVSRYQDEFELTQETEIAGVRIQAPQMHIVTVAAGGGSRLFYRNGMFQVGPESAGAHPGPACYRKNGPVAITDANLILGRLVASHFPAIFGPQENQTLSLAASQAALRQLTTTINTDRKAAGQSEYSLEEVALGFIEAANEAMARPIREISVLRGYDIQQHLLVCFGGAGGQHACAIARRLGIREIALHRHAGILSAIGIGLADVVREIQTPAAGQLATTENIAALESAFLALESEGRAALLTEGISTQAMQAQRFLNLRYQGTIQAKMIPRPADGDYLRAFLAHHQREYGFQSQAEVVIDDLRIRMVGHTEGLQAKTIKAQSSPPQALEVVAIYFAGGPLKTPVFLRDALGAGQSFRGPALVVQGGATLLIEPNCQATVDHWGTIRIRVENQAQSLHSTGADPIQLGLFNHRFMSVAEQMGRTLQRTAVSTNIKERLDFSCAVFDSTGGLVANAPHIPVHLGAMSEAVRAQLQRHGATLQTGDVLVTNDPHQGGSHLPDITVITPLIQQGKIRFFVANRGHHADIGGITPGSMPPFSRCLAEEGACISSFKLVRAGEFQEKGISELLLAPGQLVRPFGLPPLTGSRRLQDNLYDLKAQVAANQKGIALLEEMVEEHSLAVVQAYMVHIQKNAAQAVRRLVERLCDERGEAQFHLHAQDRMDDGCPIEVHITLHRQAGRLHFDFSGTGPQAWGNLNVPSAVVSSTILYVLRTLIDEEIPLNGGFLLPVTIHIPHPCLLSPTPEAAVVGGNVETSSRITDVLLQAFGAVAGAQGTMNNFSFGNSQFGYYETIGGGSGAGPDWDGKDGVHAHMSNTRITDAEVLERRYPVLLHEFSLRKNSGGAGYHTGGQGIVREIEFLSPMQATILSERRVFAPYGLAGGQTGALGHNWLIRHTGQRYALGSRNECHLVTGDRIRIETPGGGGYGDKSKR